MECYGNVQAIIPAWDAAAARELEGMRQERGDDRKNAKTERWQPLGSIHALLLVTDPSLFCEGKCPPSQQE